MSRKRKNNQFSIGKNVPKNDSGRKPMYGAPNSNLDTYNKKDGTFRSRRKYGQSGYAIKDMDAADKHKPYDHVHDIDTDNRPHADRAPDKKEKRELKKAKRKRRFW